MKKIALRTTNKSEKMNNKKQTELAVLYDWGEVADSSAPQPKPNIQWKMTVKPKTLIDAMLRCRSTMLTVQNKDEGAWR